MVSGSVAPGGLAGYFMNGTRKTTTNAALRPARTPWRAGWRGHAAVGEREREREQPADGQPVDDRGGQQPGALLHLARDRPPRERPRTRSRGRSRARPPRRRSRPRASRRTRRRGRPQMRSVAQHQWQGNASRCRPSCMYSWIMLPFTSESPRPRRPRPGTGAPAARARTWSTNRSRAARWPGDVRPLPGGHVRHGEPPG